MQKRKLGKTGIEVSELSAGAAEIGHSYQGVPQKTVHEWVRAALDAGIDTIDTAECYGSEETLGRALEGNRDGVHLFTKCGHPRGLGGGSNWSKESILQSIERSLKRLKTDRVELVLLHSCGKSELEAGECIEALETARDKGHTRFIGYSGDGDAAKYAVETGRFDVLETSVSVADQESIDLTIPEASRRGMGVIAKRSIANAAWLSGSRPPADAYGRPYWERLQKLNYDFLHEDPSDAVATALRFTLSVPGVCSAIVGTAKPDRFKENAAATKKGPLPQATYGAIRERWKNLADPSWSGQT